MSPDYYYYRKKPDEVFLNNNKSSNHYNNYQITLDRDGRNTIEIVWKNELTTLYNLFSSVKSLVSVDLLNLPGSNIASMNCMFCSCSSLVSVNLSSLITSNVTDMGNMFAGCSSLVSLDLSNFNTSIATGNSILYGCSSLRYINLFNYIGIDIFKEISNNNNLTICINDFQQIDDKTNSLQANNVINVCKKDSDETNDKTPEKKKSTNNWKTLKILKKVKALKGYRIKKRLEILSTEKLMN